MGGVAQRHGLVFFRDDERESIQHQSSLERIRSEIVSNFNADAALALRKKRGFSLGSAAGSRSVLDVRTARFAWPLCVRFP